jgi:hypothetical protein
MKSTKLWVSFRVVRRNPEVSEEYNASIRKADTEYGGDAFLRNFGLASDCSVVQSL